MRAAPGVLAAALTLPVSRAASAASMPDPWIDTVNSVVTLFRTLPSATAKTAAEAESFASQCDQSSSVPARIS